MFGLAAVCVKYLGTEVAKAINHGRRSQYLIIYSSADVLRLPLAGSEPGKNSLSEDVTHSAIGQGPSLDRSTRPVVSWHENSMLSS